MITNNEEITLVIESDDDDSATVVDDIKLPVESLTVHNDGIAVADDEPLEVEYSGSMRVEFEDKELAEKFWEIFLR